MPIYSTNYSYTSTNSTGYTATTTNATNYGNDKVSDGIRYLEDGTARLLEDGTTRVLE